MGVGWGPAGLPRCGHVKLVSLQRPGRRQGHLGWKLGPTQQLGDTQSRRARPGHFVHWQEVPASTSPSSHLADQPLLVHVPDDHLRAVSHLSPSGRGTGGYGGVRFCVPQGIVKGQPGIVFSRGLWGALGAWPS